MRARLGLSPRAARAAGHRIEPRLERRGAVLSRLVLDRASIPPPRPRSHGLAPVALHGGRQAPLLEDGARSPHGPAAALPARARLGGDVGPRERPRLLPR